MSEAIGSIWFLLSRKGYCEGYVAVRNGTYRGDVLVSTIHVTLRVDGFEGAFYPPSITNEISSMNPASPYDPLASQAHSSISSYAYREAYTVS